jgi:electron transfer flavoprotein beta subunit
VVCPIGPAKAQETIRTALAMGADRGILVQTDEEVEPLGVAKLLAKIVEEEQPSLVLLGKQAIDDDSSQVGQMLGALTGSARAPLPPRSRVAATPPTSPAKWTAGWRQVALKLPAIVTTDLRLNDPRYPSLPNIMKAKSKPLANKTPADYGVDTAPRLETLKVVEPSRASRGGAKVGSVEELVAKLKSLGCGGLSSRPSIRRCAATQDERIFCPACLSRD